MAERKFTLVTGTAEQEERIRRLLETVDSGGGPPHDGGMEARVAKLEADLTAIKIDVAVIKSNGATKADIAELKGLLKSDLADLKGSAKTDLAEARGGLKSDIAEAKSSIIMWVVMAIFIAQLLPLVRDMVKDYRTTSATAQPVPAAAVPSPAPAAVAPTPKS